MRYVCFVDMLCILYIVGVLFIMYLSVFNLCFVCVLCMCVCVAFVCVCFVCVRCMLLCSLCFVVYGRACVMHILFFEYVWFVSRLCVLCDYICLCDCICMHVLYNLRMCHVCVAYVCNVAHCLCILCVV